MKDIAICIGELVLVWQFLFGVSALALGDWRSALWLSLGLLAVVFLVAGAVVIGAVIADLREREAS